MKNMFRKRNKGTLFYKFVFFIAIAGVVLLSAGTLLIQHVSTNAGGAISWGLSFKEKNKKPDVSPKGAELLKNNNGMYMGDETQKKIYFTFDLGYEAGFTEEVLNVLKENNIKAIFFLCGNYVDQEDELIKQMLNEGHTLGNHTEKHKDLATLSLEKAKEDIVILQDKLEEKYNYHSKFFRPPSGRFNESVLGLLNGLGYKTVMWSVAYEDWGKTGMDVQKATNKVTGRLHDGAIILMHITNATTPKMLPELIKNLDEMEFRVGNPEDLLAVN